MSGVVALVVFMELGSVGLAHAQSLARSSAFESFAVDEAVPDEAPPLFAKLTMPAGTQLWPASRVFASRGSALPLLYGSLIALQGYDGYSTSRGLRNGAVESNGFMASLVTHQASLWAVKGGTAFVSIYVAERLWRQNHRGQAIALMIVSNALMVGVAANNASLVRK